MISVWIKTAGIIFAIAIGYVIKRTVFLPASSAKILSKLMINVLLPFVYICNLNGNTLSGGMLSAFFWGLGVNILLTIAAVILSRGKPKDSVFVLQYCVPGFNVSGFAIPVAQLFCSDREVAALIMFNVSITFFFFIVTPTLIHLMSPGEKRVRLKDIANDLSHNIPAMVSVIMVLLCLLHIALPEPVITAFRPLANANSAIALISLGMLFEFPKSFPKENIIALSVSSADHTFRSRSCLERHHAVRRAEKCDDHRYVSPHSKRFTGYGADAGLRGQPYRLRRFGKLAVQRGGHDDRMRDAVLEQFGPLIECFKMLIC